MLVQMPPWSQAGGTAYRPSSVSTVGNAITNPGNGYDTTAAVVDTTTSSSVATSSTTLSGSQTYSGAPSASAVAGTLSVKVQVVIDNSAGDIPGTANATASVLYSTDGSTPSLAFDQTSSWSAVSGTFDVVLTKSLTVDPSTIKVKLAQTGVKSGTSPNVKLTVVRATLYDIVFITP